MGILQPAKSGSAYLKAGIMGNAGSGKTYTATSIALGLVELMRERGLADGDKPVAFMDTETGSDWMLGRFESASVPLVVSRSRALVDLTSAIREASESCSVLIIDSITHFWTVFCDEYAERRNRTRGLEFSDWAFLKKEWRRFTDLYVNSPLHIIMCGRAGFEYDFFTNDAGKRELEKVGVKMKAENETGFEPSLLLLMEQQQALDQGDLRSISRVCKVMKDRSTRLDGRSFVNPTFDDFRPHIDCLSLGGVQVAIEARDNGQLFADDGRPRWEQVKAERAACLEEIAEVIGKHFGGQDKASKERRADLLEKHFKTRAWSRVEAMPLDAIKVARERLWLELEGVPYTFPEVPVAPPAQASLLATDEVIP